MTALPPGHYVVMQPFLTGGGRVVLRCRKCWNQWTIDLPKLPRPEQYDALRGRCPQCNTDQRYESKS